MTKGVPVSERTAKMKLGVDLPVDVISALDAYYRRTGVRKQVIVELALRRFLEAEKGRENV